MIERIDNHEDLAVARLLSQDTGKPNIEALLRELTSEVQPLEEALWQLLTERSIEAGVGAQLDVLGRIVGQRRAGLDDVTYRRYLRARIRTNRSHGSINGLLAITRLVLGELEANVTLEPQYPASLVIRVSDEPIDDTVALVLITLLRRAVSAGVRLILETSVTTDDEAFTFGVSTFLIAEALVNDTVLSVVDTDVLPVTGTLVLAAGTAAEAVLDYTVTGEQDISLADPVAVAVGEGAAVQLATGPGLGFGLTTFVTATAEVSHTELTVESTGGFPSSGTLEIEAGTGNAEVLAWTSTTSTAFVLASAVAIEHAVGSAVQFAPSVPGVPEAGGRFIRAVLA